MRRHKSTLTATVVVAICSVAIAGSVSFAWFQANADVRISASSSSASVTVSAPDQDLKITKITVLGDTTTGLIPATTAHEGKVYEIALTDTRKLTDVSGNASFLSNGTTPVTPVSLFKPVFATNYASSAVNSGYATIFDVSERTSSFSSLTTGEAYPYVRFGFKIQNISTSSKSVYATYKLTESVGMHVARASICQLTTSYTPSQTDFSSIARTSWVEKAYLGTESQAVVPVASASSDPGYTFSVDSGTGNVSVVGNAFGTYLGYSKTCVDASSGYSPASSVVTLGAADSATDSAFFAVTLWVEGQDPDCWSNTAVSDSISIEVSMY